MATVQLSPRGPRRNGFIVPLGFDGGISGPL